MHGCEGTVPQLEVAGASGRAARGTWDRSWGGWLAGKYNATFAEAPLPPSKPVCPAHTCRQAASMLLSPPADSLVPAHKAEKAHPKTSSKPSASTHLSAGSHRASSPLPAPLRQAAPPPLGQPRSLCRAPPAPLVRGSRWRPAWLRVGFGVEGWIEEWDWEQPGLARTAARGCGAACRPQPMLHYTSAAAVRTCCARHAGSECTACRTGKAAGPQHKRHGSRRAQGAHGTRRCAPDSGRSVSTAVTASRACGRHKGLWLAETLQQRLAKTLQRPLAETLQQQLGCEAQGALQPCLAD